MKATLIGIARLVNRTGKPDHVISSAFRSSRAFSLWQVPIDQYPEYEVQDRKAFSTYSDYEKYMTKIKHRPVPMEFLTLS